MFISIFTVWCVLLGQAILISEGSQIHQSKTAVPLVLEGLGTTLNFLGDATKQLGLCLEGSCAFEEKGELQ